MQCHSRLRCRGAQHCCRGTPPPTRYTICSLMDNTLLHTIKHSHRQPAAHARLPCHSSNHAAHCDLANGALAASSILGICRPSGVVLSKPAGTNTDIATQSKEHGQGHPCTCLHRSLAANCVKGYEHAKQRTGLCSSAQPHSQTQDSLAHEDRQQAADERGHDSVAGRLQHPAWQQVEGLDDLTPHVQRGVALRQHNIRVDIASTDWTLHQAVQLQAIYAYCTLRKLTRPATHAVPHDESPARTYHNFALCRSAVHLRGDTVCHHSVAVVLRIFAAEAQQVPAGTVPCICIALAAAHALGGGALPCQHAREGEAEALVQAHALHEVRPMDAAVDRLRQHE